MHGAHQDDLRLGYWIIGVITVVVVAGIVFLAISNPMVSVSSKTNRQLALTCTTDMATQFHIHPHLEIVINGQKQEITKNIGVKPNCMNSLHTHDASGVIHTEAPEKRDFTLSDFFAVWGKTYNKNQIFDDTVDATRRIRQTVNGQETEDYENTILKDGDKIIIYYEEIKP